MQKRVEELELENMRMVVEAQEKEEEVFKERAQYQKTIHGMEKTIRLYRNRISKLLVSKTTTTKTQKPTTSEVMSYLRETRNMRITRELVSITPNGRAGIAERNKRLSLPACSSAIETSPSETSTVSDNLEH